MNKRIVVTGGTKGIGRAIIEKFAANGFDIITCSRNSDELDALKIEIKKHTQIEVHTKKVDVATRKDVIDFGDYVNSLGGADVLVNNAGVFIPGQMHNEAEGALEKMINTNLYSAYHLTRKIIPEMMSRKSGHVFNICSTASIMPYVNGGSYCISKYAMLGMTKVLREEMKEHDIKVTAIMPGATLTASWEGVDLPEDRFMKAEDVAESVYAAYNLSKSAVIEEIIMRPQLGDI
ncbi:MAG: SDR family oxidoreductase [Cyclobacteriaceae bacterium]|nr:SDR family oxidoreductase [Cyclobacteriaceae bacterium]